MPSGAAGPLAGQKTWVQAGTWVGNSHTLPTGLTAQILFCGEQSPSTLLSSVPECQACSMGLSSGPQLALWPLGLVGSCGRQSSSTTPGPQVCSMSQPGSTFVSGQVSSCSPRYSQGFISCQGSLWLHRAKQPCTCGLGRQPLWGLCPVQLLVLTLHTAPPIFPGHMG